jgi:pilus assembly protein Flp/PilA
MIQLFVTLQTLPALLLERVKRDDKGATMVEYGLMVGLIAVVCIAVVVTLGTTIRDLFAQIAAQLPVN